MTSEAAGLPPHCSLGVSRPLAGEHTCRSFANHGCRSGCFSVQKLAICVAFGSPLRSRCLQFRRGLEKHRHNVLRCRSEARFTTTRRWSRGFCPGIGCVTGLHTLSPSAPAPSSSVCPVSRLSSRALRARTLVFTFCLRRQPTAPRRWLAASHLAVSGRDSVRSPSGRNAANHRAQAP